MRTFLRRTPILLLALALVAALALPAAAQPGRTYNVTITNLTRGQVLSPPIVVSHSRHVALWKVGEPASDELAAVAEDADASGLEALLESTPQVFDHTIAGGPLMPGHSVTVQVDARFPFQKISVLGMLVTTNDAFFGVTAPALPFRRMNDEYYAPAYDAGSEENNELCAFIPGPPCETPFSRAPAGAEGYVHVHAGVHGIGDLDAAERDWRNPVAKVEIQIAP